MRRAVRAGYVNMSALVALVAAAGGALLLPLSGSGSHDAVAPVTHVRLAMIEEVTAMEIPVPRTMTDEISYWEERIAEVGTELFSLEKLFQAHMLAFRAYGDPTHLDAAARAGAEIEARRPDSPAALRSASSLHLARHDFPAARRTALKLGEGVRSDATAYRVFDALWATGDREGAVAVLEQPLDTLATGYLSRKARIFDSEGHVELARDLLREVVENTQAYAEPAPVRAWALVELGHFELHSGHPDAAVRRYREALDVVPGSPAALEGLAAVAYGVDRNAAGALKLLERAFENGAHLDVLPVLADLQEESGDRVGADATRADFIARATASAASARSYRRPLAFLLAERDGGQAAAVALAREDLGERQDPESFDALAWALYRQGDVGMAWILAERATSVGAPTPPVAFRAGVIAEAAGETAAAEPLLEEALAGAVELTTREVAVAREALDRAKRR